MKDQELADKSVFNILWSFVSFAGSKVIYLVALIILARHLTPAEFGLMALCTVVIAYFEVISRFGLGQALVSRLDDWEGAADAVFFLSVFLASLMCATVWASAPWIAGYFDQPMLADYLSVLSIGLVIQSLSTVNMNLMRRQLKFKQKAVPDLVQSSVKAVVSIALAMSGFGVWSLIYGYLVSAVVELFVRYYMLPWRPSGLPRLGMIRAVTGFGVFVIFAESINALQRTLDALILGKLLGPAAVGLYTQAFRIPDVTVRSLNQVAGIVIHPVMSSIQTDMTLLRHYYYSCMRYIALFAFPISTGLAFAAEPLVHVLYPPMWHGMVGPMQLLSLAVGLMATDFLPGVIYKAINRPRYMLAVSVVKLPFFVVTLVYFAGISVTALAASQVGLAAFYIMLNVLLLRHVIKIELGKYLTALLPGVASTAFVAVAAFGVRLLEIRSDAVELLLLVPVMGAAYALGTALTSPEVFRELARMARAKARRPASVAAEQA